MRPMRCVRAVLWPRLPRPALRSFGVQRPGQHGDKARAGASCKTRGEATDAEAPEVHNIGAGPGAQDMDLAAWSKLKNSEAQSGKRVGMAISDSLSHVWQQPDAAKAAISFEQLPGVSPGVTAVLARKVLSEEECRALIAAFPTEGQGYMAGDRVAELYRDRKVKSRVLVNDAFLASLLQDRLGPQLPQVLDGGRLLQVNPNFRLVHYETGGRHSTHIDGREPVQPRRDEEANGWVQSRLTMQVYLNSHGKDFEGGEFAIVDAEEEGGEVRVKHTVRPSAGDVVLFYQERLDPPSQCPPYELQHQGNDVTWGEKFACRTMVDYIFPDEETARLSNVKDDTMFSSNGASPSVLAIGNTIIDTMLTISHIPIDEKIHVRSKQTYVGGQGANAAQAMAQLGLRVAFLTRLGDDVEGQTALQAYEGLDMDLRHALVVPGAQTSVATVLVASDEERHRSCLIHDDKNLMEACGQEKVEAAIQRLRSGHFSAVYTDGWQLDMALPICRAAKELGVPIVADIEAISQKTMELAELSTVLIASGIYVKILAGMPDLVVSLQMLASPTRTVIATLGAKGSLGLVGDGEVIFVPALEVDVQDTTGAGDTYHAGYAVAFLRGQGLEEAMTFATTAAAAKCTTPGPAVTLAALQRFGLAPS
ncbi:unnamed protein product [Effrenium voratum]|uniref:Fe2OG dioxygenase domain-containing protein n=1 Tax=Effrenium voratum TaxID=2562239 RepID=A0AA36MHT0_9DINO|nr:unnamed protein product [Effrenium voratum]